ncbi:unconventional myosin-VI-like [Paramacrobiotus metropolitanus]|uniref:unconventional myosin-VI-like n=1 Tax=Paramacrobiotus metropolitanus TaxID=2943436 RepID=UPI0024458D0B|nr:unconventional myosin-VI-like [Paramacrobiotus metropolitanus]
MIDKGKVWAPDAVDGYKLGKVVDIGTEEITVELTENGKSVAAPYDKVFPAEKDDKKTVDDNCALMHVNEATLLHNVRLRYTKDSIYTYVANILIAVNPYFELPALYSQQTIKKYQGQSLGTLPPHVFAIADKAFRDMRALKQSQSIIVSGESGAGKTESTKYILRYLCESWGSHAGPLEERILEANPILEAFGNAKTLRNNNSSRFGKFVEIHFNTKQQVAGGFISHYLLEKSRICIQSEGERNYHIFYQMLAGAPETLRSKFRLTTPADFHYLNRGALKFFANKENQKILSTKGLQSNVGLQDSILDDVRDYQRTDVALTHLGLSEDDKLMVYATVAAVLHLGNIVFEDSGDAKDGCRVSKNSEQSLMLTSVLMGVDKDALRDALTSRVMQASRGGFKGTVIRVNLKHYEAGSARDALAKAVYSKLFDYIVGKINDCIPFASSQYYIGILDIAGFEYFTFNSFEQFCINYCNEKLQQFFNERILKSEQQLYEKEGLGVGKITYIDNQDCIDLIEMKGSGLLDLLDEESKLPKPSNQNFTETIHSKHKNHFRLNTPRKSKLKEHRDLLDNEGFLIRHFAGGVCYQTGQFIEKNNDALHASLEALIQESENLKYLFSGQNGIPSVTNQGKLTFISVGNKFRTQLKQLMEKLNSTGTSFIRCIKPNMSMVDHLFEGGLVLNQLQCSGMTSVLQLMQQGYPSRCYFTDLYSMYKDFLPKGLANLDPRLFCKALFRALGLNDTDYKFGVSRVFFKPGKFAEFDQMLRADPENLAKLVEKVKVWLLHARWRKAQYGAWSVLKLRNKILYRRAALIKIQSTVRMYLAKKKYRPRILGLKRLQILHDQLDRMRELAQELRADREKALSQVIAVKQSMEKLTSDIKFLQIKNQDIDPAVKRLLENAQRVLGDLQKQVQAQKTKEEQERLRKIQEEMERAKREREEEEKRKKQEEEERQMRIQMEERRKVEEERARLMEQDNKKLAAKLAAERTKQLEESQARELLAEQEERDHALALRLAQDNGGQVDELSPLQRSSSYMKQRQQQAGKRHDLSKWKYADLRDVINTSCDLELLEACREEFHRRLKVYHAWKAKNRKGNDDANRPRAPNSVMENAKDSPLLTSGKVTSSEQRFFRIPFVKPTSNGVNEKKRGWWYAHFDGQWIARQMEIYPDKQPVLLVAGKDDMNMCELSLEDTGLPQKRGAEILQSDFESEWAKHGGSAQAYVRPQSRQSRR